MSIKWRNFLLCLYVLGGLVHRTYYQEHIDLLVEECHQDPTFQQCHELGILLDLSVSFGWVFWWVSHYLEELMEQRRIYEVG